MMSVDCLLIICYAGRICSATKKKRSKAKSASAGQSSHDDRSNGLSTPALRQLEDDENRLENNQVKVRNASMNFQT